MLQRLHITNYALIEYLEIDFAPGLTIITGETGAGKSIIMGALSLILGERADVKAMRNPEQKTVVEATFDITSYHLQSLLESAEADDAGNECILRRELLPSGRSRAFVNDTPVQLGFLRDVATRLIDIHSQHSNMLLARSQFQLDMLDSLAGNGRLLSRYAQAYREFKSLEKQIETLAASYQQVRSEEDYMRFQLEQLQAMNLQPAEDVQLEAEQAKLSNVTDIKRSLSEVDHLFHDENLSVIQHLKTIVDRLHSLEPLLAEVQGMSSRVGSSLIDLKDIADTVSGLQDDLQFDPAKLEMIDGRLNDIYQLERKHQVQSVDELIAIQRELDQRLSVLDCSDEKLQMLKAQLDDLKAQAGQVAKQISDERKKAAKSFAEQLKASAQSLALTNLQFEVVFNHTDLTLSGMDAVEFLVAFNKNQQLMPVKDTASGGEISRLMLCMKEILAHHVKLPTIIFDEVDTGVSGDTASMMGEMMGQIAQDIQVISITHLPQVASHGDHHFKVYKTDEVASTVTHVTKLNQEQHIMEIARMLSGKDLNQAAIENARSLLTQNNKL